MSRHQIRLIVLLVFVWTCVQVTSAVAALPEFVDLARDLKPAVVNINTTTTAKIQQPNAPGFGGSGNELFDEFFGKFFVASRICRARVTPLVPALLLM